MLAHRSKVDESSMTFNSFVNDAAAIVRYFEKDFDDIIVLGHSEGALIGSIVARNKNVHSFISVCGISQSFDEVLLTQLSKYPDLVPLAENHIMEIKNGDTLSEVNPILQTLFRPSLLPFLKSAFALDPSHEIATVHKPVLIIGGECDQQVPTDHARKLHQSCQDSELVIINNMGHVMKELEADCANAISAYNEPSLALNKTFTTSIYNFINR